MGWMNTLNWARRATTNLDNISDLIYQIKHCNEPAIIIGLKTELRRMVREYGRLPDSIQRLVNTIFYD
jgi:hypothetical protein